MKRADRGIERLDYNTYEVLLGGLGNTPEDVGINVKKFYVAPRLGAIYRFNDEHRAARRLRPHLQPAALVASDARLVSPTTSSSTRPRSSTGRSRSQNGIPPVPIPDLSSGRVKLPPSTFIRSPNPNDVDRATIQQMNIALEQRLPGDISVELAYVHTRTDGGYADLDVNHSEPGAGQAGRKFFAVAGTTAINDWASRTKSRYQRPAGGAQPAVPERPAPEGRLHPEPVGERDRTTRTAGPASPGTIPSLSRQELRPRRLRPHPRLPDGLRLRAAVRQAAPTSVLGRIVQNWQVNGIGSAYSGTPFSINGTNPAAQLPGLRSDPDQRAGRPEPDRHPRLADRALVRQVALLAADGRGLRWLRQQPPEPVPQPRRLERGPRASSARSRSGRIRPEIRIEATNVFNHTNWARPNLTFTVAAVPDLRAHGRAPGQPDLGHGHARTDGADRPAARVLGSRGRTSVP